MSESVKSVLDYSECDPELLSSFIESLSLEPIPDISNSLDVLENVQNINQNQNLDNQKLSTEKKLVIDNNNDLEDKLNLPKEETTFISSEEKETVISVKKDVGDKEFTILDSELLSDSSFDSDSDDSDSLIRRGKEKTKRKPSSRKQYERPTHRVNVSELNQRSLQLLSSGYIVQNNAVNNLQSTQAQFVNSPSFLLHPTQNVDSANYNDCSINSPLNISSPESGYDTQSSEVLSPSPPNILPILSRNIIEEERELQFITDNILELEESLKNIDAQHLEGNIPGIDDFGFNDYIEQMKLYFMEPYNEVDTNTTVSEYCFNLKDSECSSNETRDFIPLENLLDDFETESSLQSISTDTSSELEYNQPASNVHNTALSSCSSLTKPTEIKIDYKLKDIAKHHVRFSEAFDNEKYLVEIRNVLEEVRIKKRCIDFEQQTLHCKRTNLHNAVLSSNIERIYCLVEIQKKLFHSIQLEINFRDVYDKTALNYAEKLKLPLIVDYLKENLAVKSV